MVMTIHSGRLPDLRKASTTRSRFVAFLRRWPELELPPGEVLLRLFRQLLAVVLRDDAAGRNDHLAARLEDEILVNLVLEQARQALLERLGGGRHLVEQGLALRFDGLQRGRLLRFEVRDP